MNDIERYNTLLSVCSGIDPPQNDLVEGDRRVISMMECHVDVNGKGKKGAKLILLSDVVLITQVGFEKICDLEQTFFVFEVSNSIDRSIKHSRLLCFFQSNKPLF